MSRTIRSYRHSQMPDFSRARRLMVSVSIAASSLFLISAAAPPTGLEGLGREVPDQELSEMRGKFVRANDIHFFGVELVQSWQSADGVTLMATLQFNVDFAKGAGNLDGATPTIQIAWDRVCKVCADPSMDVSSLQSGPSNGSQLANAEPILTIGKFGSLEGLVQTQEIAGSNNDVLNTMRVSVVPSSAIQSLPDGEVPSIASSVSHVTEQGETIDFNVARNQLGLAINRGDETVRQGISGELNQAAQHVILQSSLNAIRNEMAITVGVNDLNQARQHSVQTALSAMKGRGM